MGPLQILPYVPPTDDAGIASGLLLREVHCALLRGVEGRGLGADGADAPRSARLVAADAQAASAWTSRVSKAVLDAPPFAVDDDARVRSTPLTSAAPLPSSGATKAVEILKLLTTLLKAYACIGSVCKALSCISAVPRSTFTSSPQCVYVIELCICAQVAAVHLAYAEYDDLMVMERIAILRGLSGLALSAEAVRDHISARIEALPAPVQRRKVRPIQISPNGHYI